MRIAVVPMLLALALAAGCASGPGRDHGSEAPVVLVALADPVPPPPGPTDPVAPTESAAPAAEKKTPPAPVAPEDRKPPSYRFFRVEASLGRGRYEQDTDGGAFNLKDDTGAGFGRIIFEAANSRGVGGGVSAEVVASDDDLLDSDLDPYKARVVDVFAYFLYRGRGVGDERFIIPLKGGFFVQQIDVRDQTGSQDVTWNSVGLRVGTSPEVRFFRTGAVDWQGYADFTIGIQATQAELHGVTDRLTTSGTSVAAEVGARVVIARHFTIALSYLFRGTWLGKTDTDENVRLGETSSIFYGPALTVGLRF